MLIRPALVRAAQTLAPGPSPHGALSMPPSVLKVPAGEYVEFMEKIVGRYVSTLGSHWTTALTEVARRPSAEPMPDDAFSALFYDSAIARILVRTIDEESASLFARELASPVAGGRFVIADFRCFEVVDEYLPGLHGGPNVTLFEEVTGAGEHLVPRAIACGDVVLRPSDGPAWELAKYHVTQNAGHALIVAFHPRLHFPMDPINAVTRRVLPPGHVIRQLIEPHCFMSLSLNWSVLYHFHSVAWNHQSHAYSPFSTPMASQIKLVKAGYAGHRGLPAWPAYRYPLSVPEVVGPYGRFLATYHAVIGDHVARVLAHVEQGDPLVSQWADEIARHVPGFPGQFAIWRPGTLVAAVTSFVADVTLHHSADHYNYGVSTSVNKTPLRVRLPPPKSNRIPAFERKQICRRRDLFRQLLAHEMFFKLHTIQPLVDIAYEWSDPAMNGLAGRFVSELRRVPGTLDTREYIPLDQIATSIQS